MITLRPFFPYYGGKWRSAKRYSVPKYETLIEPFAGSAGYSLRHYIHNVKLYDVDPIIAGLWNYLIRVSPAEIRSLPARLDHVDELPLEEARWLVGFWFNRAAEQPRPMPSSWMKRWVGETGYGLSYWGEPVKERIATQVEHIRHWTCEQADYETIANNSASWFIDPPYTASGHIYRHHQIDYQRLGEWSRGRRGQAIVCEQAGADWLPFQTLGDHRSTNGKIRKETYWEGNNEEPSVPSRSLNRSHFAGTRLDAYD